MLGVEFSPMVGMGESLNGRVPFLQFRTGCIRLADKPKDKSVFSVHLLCKLPELIIRARLIYA